MAQSYETRSPTLIPVKLADFKPPQSWYDETVDPFAPDDESTNAKSEPEVALIDSAK